MRRALIETISRSEKRKDVLLLLQNGPVSMSNILQALDVSRNALLPQMKILEEAHLIKKNEKDDTYFLSKFGEIIIRDLEPLLSTLEVLEKQMDYLLSHNIDFVPAELLYRIRELKTCKLIEPDLHEALDLSQIAIEKCLKSEKIFCVTSIYHSEYPPLFTKYAKNESEFNFVITEDVLAKFIEDDKQKLEELIQYPNINFYIYPYKIELSSVLMATDLMLLKLLTFNEIYDPRYLISSEQEAIIWGKELFDHYFSKAEPLLSVE
ncbi:winged helix-turn-helix domain-containing protein [Methanolobus sp. WCC1]|uniref:helix-turn-helix transcriptional regulator n=1 Tax=unclassified Methanolobus TaxID=2629569 RepID=UPI003255F091